jgi:hypothetical protein
MLLRVFSASYFLRGAAFAVPRRAPVRGAAADFCLDTMVGIIDTRAAVSTSNAVLRYGERR